MIGATATQGLLAPDDSPWRYAYLALADIRLPLFTVISGYVYAMRPVERWQNYPRLVAGKSRRLLIPLITVGTLLYAALEIVPDTNSKPSVALWQTYLFGFEHLWFLQSIFLIFLTVGVLDSWGALASRQSWAVVTIAASIVFVIVHIPPTLDVFTVSGAVRLLPFFLLGYGLRRHSLFDLRGRPALLAVAAFAAVYAVRLLVVFRVYSLDVHADRALTIAVGAIAVVLIYSARNLVNARVLVWIGGFSFGIYLFHVFATAASRIALEHLGLHARPELFVVGLVAGIAAPIAFQLAVRRSRLLHTLLFGEKTQAPVRRRPALEAAPRTRNPWTIGQATIGQARVELARLSAFVTRIGSMPERRAAPTRPPSVH
ncbi:acyltransferase [Rhodococcus olei]|uniref:Acyltransferase n=1 Tax=Rhodococcus olei TaxID=2161675 RepID=A0ABP8NUL3_9NOCA